MYAVAERLGYLKLQPRSSSPLGLFSAFDGNIIGGSLLGIGMAMSGSCPGTLLTQLAAGVRTGVHALNGAILGGIIWTGASKAVKKHKETTNTKNEVRTLDEQLGVSKDTALLILESIFIAFVAATTILTPKPAEVKIIGALGGLAIGSAQLVSLVTRKSMIGISGSYEEIGNNFWWVVKGAGSASRPRSFQNILFGTGLVVGAWTLAQLSPALVTATVTEVPPLLATVGGALMIIGSRMAGGCTSGHGISGISLLSTSSVVTIASAFAAGIAVAPLIH